MEQLLTVIMQGISAVGSVWGYVVVVPVCAALAALRGRRDLSMAIVLVTVGNLLNPVIKNIVRRPRPTDLFDGYSFPSGHALGAMIFYGFLAYLAWRSGKHVWALFLALLIVLIGYSRVYLGAHVASDVIGGYLIGALWLIVFMRIPRVQRLMT